MCANGLVETETATIEHHLVDVGAVQTTQQAPDTLVFEDDRHAVKHTSVHLGSILSGLKLTLKLQPYLDSLEAVSYCDGAACCNTTGNKRTGQVASVALPGVEGKVWVNYPMPVDMAACQITKKGCIDKCK